MAIVIKFILRNIKEKKFRTFLIVFSVMLSAALFFASLALSGTIEQTFMEKIKKNIGTAEVIIHANEKSPFRMFRLAKTAVVKQNLEYAIGAVETDATYKTAKESINIDLKGYDLPDLQTMNPYVLAEQLDLMPFEGRKLIVSQKTAQNLHFKVGANLELKINGNRYRFKIVGIAQPSGLFQDDGRSNTAVCPREFLARVFDAPGRVTMAYLKLKDPRRIAAVIDTLSNEYRRYTVREPMSRAELKEYSQGVTVPFFMMLVLVLFISIFIIYSSFKVITRERLPIIGTFRSVGATRKMTDFVLFMESGLYGICGGVLGCLLGLGILYIMACQMRPEWIKNVPVVLTYSPLQLLAAFLLAVLLPLFSSFFPIVKISQLPVKEIIFNTMDSSKKPGGLQNILGFVFLIGVLIAPQLAPKNWALLIDIFCMLLAVLAIVMLTPLLTSGFLKLFEWLYEYLLGNEGVLAAKNLRENQSILNNIALLAIGISSLLMINTLSFSVVKELTNLFKDAKFDIWLECQQADRRLSGILRSTDGVSEIYGIYSALGTEIAGTKDKISLIHGIDTRHYFDYWDIPVSGDRVQLLRQMDADRKIMLSFMLKEKLQVKEGDELTLKMKRGKRVYKVVGFFSSIMWGGSYALVAERYLKSDMQLQNYDSVYIKTNKDPVRIAEMLKKKVARRYPWIETMKNLTKQELQSNQQMLTLLQGFSVLTLLIGLFGVFNNLMISFIERKRSLAMMRSVGMSQRQTLKIIFIESFTGGIIGGLIGITAGTLLIGIIPFLMKAVNQNLPIHYSIKEYGIALVCGVVITVAASIAPALKSSRLNIIEAIKYE